MKKANLRLMGFLCPIIKHRIHNTVAFYQWFLIPLTVLFVSCQALAQEVKVQQMPLAATVSTKIQSYFNSTIKSYWLFIALIILISTEGKAQDFGLLEGMVKSESTGLPLEGAQIKVEGTDDYTFANQHGKFSLKTSSTNGKATVVFRGYEQLSRNFKEGALKKGATTFRMKADVSKIPAIRIGDVIPDSFWDLPLHIINHPDDRKVISLREYKNEKLLILDFWATWCSPCIKSMDKWESYAKALNDEIKVIGVYVGNSSRALDLIHKKNWKMPTIINENSRSINRYFFEEDVLTRMVWIKNGRLLTISGLNGYDLEVVKNVLNNTNVNLPLDTRNIIYTH